MVSLGEGPFVLTGRPAPVRKTDETPSGRPDRPRGLQSIRTGRGVTPRSRSGEAVSGAARWSLRDIGSSQYVSSLLIAAPFAAAETAIVLEGRIPSLPYIALTVETMAAFGVKVLTEGAGRYVISCGQTLRGA